jgi:hypothetical protein
MPDCKKQMQNRSRRSRGLFKSRICFGVLFLVSFFAMLLTNRKVLLFGAWPCGLGTSLFSNAGFETYWAQNCWQISNTDLKKFDYSIIDIYGQPDKCIDMLANKTHWRSPNTIIIRDIKPTPDTARHFLQIEEWQKNAPYRYFRWIFYFALCGLGTILTLDFFETLHGRKEIL